MAGDQVEVIRVGLVKKYMGASAGRRSRLKLGGKLLSHGGRDRMELQKCSIQQACLSMILTTSRIRRVDLMGRIR